MGAQTLMDRSTSFVERFLSLVQFESRKKQKNYCQKGTEIPEIKPIAVRVSVGGNLKRLGKIEKNPAITFENACIKPEDRVQY